MSRRARPLLALLTLLAVGLLAPAAHAQSAGPTDPPPVEPPPGPPYDAVVRITFPVDGQVSFRDDYHDPRGGGTRVHRATDLGGANAYGLPIHAAMGGTVTWITGLDDGVAHATAGFALTVRGDDGRSYSYMHLGRNDGPLTEAYAPGITRGVRVERGQLLGYLGYSGNASRSWPHLHFEIHDPAVTDPYGSHRMNPYNSLRDALARGDLPVDTRRFLDVAPASAHYAAVLWLAEAGYTEGCAPRRFCPAASVTRGQTAAFLARALALPEPTTAPFDDVPAGHTHARAIAQVHEAGIVRGSGDGTFGPARPVTREQMASMLAAARGLETSLAPASVPFSDVDPASVHAPAITALQQQGIVQGAADGAFQPTRPVTREQMASFLSRTFAPA